MSCTSTPVRQQHDPAAWREHRFGLPPARWEALRGRSFWVTGAGTGYGRCIAIALAAAGSRVFVTGRRREMLEETRVEAAALGADSARCIAVPADIRRADEIDAAARTIAHQGGDPLFGLVNNAALPEPAAGPWPLSGLEPQAWNDLLATNVTGQWLASRAALPLLARGPGFRILFVTSEAGWAFTAGFGPYNVSKAALNSLGASLAEECAARLADKDVQVNVLVPGEARTEMNRGSLDSPWSVVPMTLLLLSHPAPGPNGRFFHRDGRHLEFARAGAHARSLLEPTAGPARGFARLLGRLRGAS